MILELMLSIVITYGASGPSGNFNECPPADQPTVETVQDTTTTTTNTAVKKKG